jgi:hypothetical protein
MVPDSVSPSPPANGGRNSQAGEKARNFQAQANRAGYEKAQAVFYPGDHDCISMKIDEVNSVEPCAETPPQYLVILEGPIGGAPSFAPPAGTRRPDGRREVTKAQADEYEQWRNREGTARSDAAQSRGIANAVVGYFEMSRATTLG